MKINTIFSKIKNVFILNNNIQANVAKSSVYLMVQRFSIRAVSFVKTIILARLLFPSDFGLFGLATLTIATIEALTQTGYSQAVIQKKEVSDDELNAIWTFQMVLYLTLGVVTMFVIAPIAGHVFNNQSLPLLVSCLSLTLIIRAFDNVGMVMWLKQMRYDKQFWYDVIPAIIEIIMAIVLALVLKNVWALVISTLIGRSCFLVGSYVFHPFRPKIYFSKKLLFPFLKYGKWLGLAGIVSFVASRFDQMVLGVNLDTSELGHYVIAMSLGTLPATELAKAFSTILFPLYSKYSLNKGELLNVYNRVTKVIASVAIPATFGLLVLAANFVLVIYGPKWLAMTLVVKLFCLLGIVKTIDYLIAPLTLGSGKSKIAFLNSSIIALVSIAFSVPAIKSYGSIGAVSVILIGQTIAVLVNNYFLATKLNWKLFDIYKPIIIPFFSSLIMAILLNWFKSFFSNDLLGLIVKILFGVTCYYIIIMFFDKVLGNNSLKNSWTWLKTNLLNS
jgi:lipopolysaccharide exporter